MPNSTAGPLYILSTINIALETCFGSDHFENTCKKHQYSLPPSILFFFLSLLLLIDCILSMNLNVMVIIFVTISSVNSSCTLLWCCFIFFPHIDWRLFWVSLQFDVENHYHEMSFEKTHTSGTFDF